MAIGEGKRIFAKQAGSSMQKAEEEALTNVFIGEFKATNTRFKNSFRYFVEVVLARITTKRSLEDIL